VQIESKTAVDNIDGILSVPGIDAVFIGAYDLSASMDVPGQLDNAGVQSAIETVFAKAKKAKMPIGLFKPNVEAAKSAIEKGAKLLVVGIDTIHIAEAARKIAEISG
jgi:2-keto-3-deoxy-L-rhamnonate aldolase RhmA